MYINYSEISGYSNIFLDYIYEFKNVEKYFKLNFRDKKTYENIFEKIVTKKRPHQEKVAAIIAQQYKGFKLSQQTKYNLRLLEQKETIAIVTGQQLGIMGGPLYTFYKIITTIKLVSNLKSKYDKYNFVPIFWLEGDDHDFEEVASFSYIDKNNNLTKLTYDDDLDADVNRGNVGSLEFKRTIKKIFESLDKTLRGTEFTDNLLNLMYSCYKEKATFKTAFKKLLFNIFDEYGLIIFDPQDKKIKKILTPIFKNEITNFRKHTDISVERSAELEELYHAQVKVKPINLFLSDEVGRYSIEPYENNYKLKGKKGSLSEEDIFDLLETSPENFSPNVLLRPICQDFLLPTGVYVGGPGEISYFAQVIPLYDLFNVAQPILYPRASATIIEKNISKILDKYNLKYQDYQFGKKHLTEKIITDLETIEVKKEISNTKIEFELAFDRLKEKLFAIEPTLKKTSEKTFEKIINTLEQLKGKALKAQEKNNETVLNQINKSYDFLMPYSISQEREINFIYFANKYGINILKLLMNELNVDKYEHQIIEL